MASVALSPPAYSFLRDRRKSDRSLSLLLIPAGYKPFSCCKNSTIVGPASAALAKRWLSPLRPVILVTVAEVDFAAAAAAFAAREWGAVNYLGRSEAIRRLVELGLKAKGK
jgi:hypothetical protein